MKKKIHRRSLTFGGLLLSVIFLMAMMVIPSETEAREIIKLRVAAGHPYSQGTYWIESLEEFFCREAEKRVLEMTDDYELKFTGYYGGSLCKLGEALETAQRGLADIVMIVICFEPSKLEGLMFSQWLPFATHDLKKMTAATTRTFDHFTPLFNKELGKYNQRMLGHGYWLQTAYNPLTKFPINKLEDIHHKRLAHGGPMLPWIDALGGTSVKVNYNELYTAMDTGVIDGCPVPANVATSFKIYEVATHYVEIPLIGANVAGLLTINNKTWKKLPKKVQDILVETSNDYTANVYDRCMAEEAKARKIMKDAGVEIVSIPDTELARWAKKLEDEGVTAKTIANAEANGWPAEEIARYFVKELQAENAKFLYPYRLK